MTAVWGAGRLLFSRKEVGILLNLSPRQITRQIQNGKLRIVRVGRRTLIHKDEVGTLRQERTALHEPSIGFVYLMGSLQSLYNLSLICVVALVSGSKSRISTKARRSTQ
jgi:excisionase family DNA binding protein